MSSKPSENVAPRAGSGDAPKPVVAMVLPPHVFGWMFRPHDLQRLGAVADVRGPFGDEDRATGPARAALGEAVVAVAGWGSPRFDAGLLALAPNLQLLAYSAGTVKPVVSDALYDRGIRVTTAAAANAVPVAHFTVAMMVAMLKQAPWIAPAFARGDGAEVERRRPHLRELQDLEVGLIGASRVGREVIKLLKAYPGLTIKVYDPFLTDVSAEALGVRAVPLDEACRCEVVSCHAPNVPQTRRLFDARTLRLLPDHAVFINTSRGALVDESALVAEVCRRPLYVLLDVTDPEPPAADSPLRGRENILLTPHVAGAMKQGRCELGKLAIDETLRFLRGQALQHEVTRDMLPTQA